MLEIQFWIDYPNIRSYLRNLSLAAQNSPFQVKKIIFFREGAYSLSLPGGYTTRSKRTSLLDPPPRLLEFQAGLRVRCKSAAVDKDST